MAEIRSEVRHFMKEFERFFIFASLNGGLNEEECDALKYYAGELSTHVLKFCHSRSHRAG